MTTEEARATLQALSEGYRAAVIAKGGPGTELKNILSAFGIKESGGCGCMTYAAGMNRGGPQWCRDNIDSIAGRMESEARQRGWKLPAMRFGARQLVRLAIWKSSSEIRKSALGPSNHPTDTQ